MAEKTVSLKRIRFSYNVDRLNLSFEQISNYIRKNTKRENKNKFKLRVTYVRKEEIFVKTPTQCN